MKLLKCFFQIRIHFVLIKRTAVFLKALRHSKYSLFQI